MYQRNVKSNLSQISNGSTMIKKSGAFGHLNRGDSKIRIQIKKSNIKRNSISIVNKANHEKLETLRKTKNEFRNRIEINQLLLEMKEMHNDVTHQNISKETLNNNKIGENYTQ